MAAGEAPQLRIESQQTSEAWLLARYEAWRVHHASCGQCTTGSWYEPNFTLRPCRAGRLKFEAWVRLASAVNIPKG